MATEAGVTGFRLTRAAPALAPGATSWARRPLLLSLLGPSILEATACTPARTPPPASHDGPPPLDARVPPAQPLSPAEVDAEAARLREALLREARADANLAFEPRQGWIMRVQATAARAGLVLDRPVLLTSVDRNPGVQALAVVLARPGGNWEILGGCRVSTGEPNRRGHFITPTGVFLHTDAVLDWRAAGTFNEHHIRGLGLRGMRVWDFGWVQASKGWRADGEAGEIRLLLHATDPDLLEPRLGRPASLGCVRIPSAMNLFLDRHGVLDADYEQAAVGDARFRALLLPDRTPTPLAGRALVVIDSSEPL